MIQKKVVRFSFQPLHADAVASAAAAVAAPCNALKLTYHPIAIHFCIHSSTCTQRPNDGGGEKKM